MLLVLRSCHYDLLFINGLAQCEKKWIWMYRSENASVCLRSPGTLIHGLYCEWKTLITVAARCVYSLLDRACSLFSVWSRARFLYFPSLPFVKSCFFGFYIHLLLISRQKYWCCQREKTTKLFISLFRSAKRFFFLHDIYVWRERLSIWYSLQLNYRSKQLIWFSNFVLQISHDFWNHSSFHKFATNAVIMAWWIFCPEREAKS